MKLTFLGTGTSVGVPEIGCKCPVCCSSDIRDRRLRCSALVTIGSHNLLIDCGPDFRTQMLRCGSPHLDALLVTHTHYDHLGGIDDLRPYCKKAPTSAGFPIYCRKEVARDIHTRMPYCFGDNAYPGSPRFDIHIINDTPFSIDGIEIIPLKVYHTDTYRITGFRIGPLCYITDCKHLPDETVARMIGTDTLVINALRHDPHPSHLNLQQALEIIDLIKPRQAYLTHFSHGIGRHAVTSDTLPPNVNMAYDGLTIII